MRSGSFGSGIEHNLDKFSNHLFKVFKFGFYIYVQRNNLDKSVGFTVRVYADVNMDVSDKIKHIDEIPEPKY